MEQQSRWLGTGDHSHVLPLQVYSLLQDSHILHFLCFCSLLMLCRQIKISKLSGEETALHDLCWYSGRVVNVLCAIAEYIWHFPEEVESFVKEVKMISGWFLVLLVFGFVFFFFF